MESEKIIAQEPNSVNGMWGYDGVDLTDTFVLSWNFTSHQLVYCLECSLWPGHPLYEEPLPDRYTCYKIGNLVFENVVGLDEYADMSKCIPVPAANGNGVPDYGCIDALDKLGNNFWILDGDFGTVKIRSDPPNLRIYGPQL